MPINHVIQRLTLETTATDMETARQQQDDLSHWVKSEAFWQTLSDRLDRVVPADRVVSIPKLEIVVTGANEATFQKDFIEAFVQEIEHVLQNQKEHISQSEEAHLIELALFFLEKGYLPATVGKGYAVKVQQYLKNVVARGDRSFWQLFYQRTVLQPQIIERLIQHIGIEQTRAFFIQGLVLNVGIATWIERYINTTIANKVIENKRQLIENETFIWKIIFKKATIVDIQNEVNFIKYINENIPPSVLRLIKTDETKGDGYRKTIEETAAELQQKEAYREVIEDGIFIDNAGLVLLWQYLPQLFKALGWVEGKGWRDEETAHQAVRLLAYLVQGESDTETWEYDWTLNKILCGLPLDTVIKQSDPLSIEAKEMADNLLKAAISHWTILKNTSPAGLRAMFLQRSGKLSQRPEGDGWRLQVERKTEDILLERLPAGWGYSVVRLPWMTDMVFVEW
jgi:Contractile injection system tape measure protein